MKITFSWDSRAAAALAHGLEGAVLRALSKAGSTALRDMRAEAGKRIRQRKRLRLSFISRAFTLRRPRRSSIDRMEWALEVSGKPVPLVGYPHRQTKRGVSVEVNVGKRTLVEHAFEARMKSGHVGVFKRRGKGRLPIAEQFGSRPVDALLHAGEADAIADRGQRTLGATFERLLPLEIEKARK